MKKTIFITGASKGFGRIWAEAALQRGDNVVATARKITDLAGLVETYGSAVLPLQLDVTDKAADFQAIAQAFAHFGRLDVVINNAGYGLFGAIEENTEAEVRAQMETNFFGAFWITQAALPIMRLQGSGHILQVSSIGGVISLPILGVYHASKYALEGFSESLAKEVAPFGIKVTLIEPGGYATDWSGSSAIRSTAIDVYEPVKKALYATFEASPAGNPQATGAAILELIDAPNPPLRLLLGKVFPWIKGVYEERLHTWEQWNAVAEAAQ